MGDIHGASLWHQFLENCCRDNLDYCRTTETTHAAFFREKAISWSHSDIMADPGCCAESPCIRCNARRNGNDPSIQYAPESCQNDPRLPFTALPCSQAA